MQNKGLLVSGLKIGEEWAVYTISGVLVFKGIATKEEESIILNVAKGVYVVKSRNEAVKVIEQ